MRFCFKAVTVGLVVVATPAFSADHTEVTACFSQAVYDLANSKECPSLEQIRRKVLQVNCASVVESYLQTFPPEDRDIMRESAGDVAKAFVEGSAPDYLKRNFCN